MVFVNWDPFRELNSLRREVERAFETFGSEWRGLPFSRASFLPGRSGHSYPLMNISEDKDNVYVEALAPGVNPDSLEITVLRDVLRVAGEKQAISSDIKPEAFHRNERGNGAFVRTIKLPVEVNSESVKADYKNGLLLITLPKTEAAKPKQIAVTVS